MRKLKYILSLAMEMVLQVVISLAIANFVLKIEIAIFRAVVGISTNWILHRFIVFVYDRGKKKLPWQIYEIKLDNDEVLISFMSPDLSLISKIQMRYGLKET